jgi:hypothetical protein
MIKMPEGEKGRGGTPSGLRLMALLQFMVLLCSGSVAIAQQKDMIVLKHADLLSGRTVNGEDVREVTGNVHFVQGNVFVW